MKTITGGAMKVTVDEDKCIGAGQCAFTAPHVFDQRDEDGVVILLAEIPPAADEPAARDAATLCPAGVIKILDGDVENR
ncbi:ferredoxin [Actinoplanes campanulatus]